jgi:GntR family transcriptional repressor for pyruvate dehydrogenase complex
MVEDLFHNVNRSKATDLIVAEVQDLIVSRRLKAGDKLPSERDLALKFNVSRNVLREALGVLRQRGLVEVLPGRGTVVTNPSYDSMQDTVALLLRLQHVSLIELCDARMLIEPELAWRAASLPKTVSTEKLVRLGERLRESSDSAEEHVKADLEFHEEIAHLSGHGVFSAFVGAVREPVTRSMVFGTKVPRAIDASDEQHIAILDAITRRDPKEARWAMSEHIRYVAEYIRDNDVELVDWSLS